MRSAAAAAAHGVKTIITSAPAPPPLQYAQESSGVCVWLGCLESSVNRASFRYDFANTFFSRDFTRKCSKRCALLARVCIMCAASALGRL